MESLVVDASVVVKWFVVEEHRKEALELREDYVDGKFTLAAPSLMPYEVINAVRHSKKNITVEILGTVADSLALYGIRLYELRGNLARKTVETTIENGLAVYDAAYIALAKLSDTTLYTADEELGNRLKNTYRKYVRHIKHYGGS